MADNDLQESIQEIRNLIARLKRLESQARAQWLAAGRRRLADMKKAEQARAQIVVH